MGPYQKQEDNKAKQAKAPSPIFFPKESANDGRHPLIQFERAEKSGLKTHHNDALVITALLAKNEVGRIFIDSESSADILFREAYDQMQLGNVPLEKVNTSLYEFVEKIRPKGYDLDFFDVGNMDSSKDMHAKVSSGRRVVCLPRYSREAYPECFSKP
ncbi:UNVERIFIED_CONTAM: hypothetical protein Scaly_0264400 [Sesamum calycinum]|uniref:Uncharacterized protein n=1 Tax=Sesamum calycinum TaxID=2727403 RepID=A0AAW2SBI4_9LAMI